MSRQLRLEHPGAIWHVTSRGNEKRPIFHDDRDRTVFLDLLAEVISVRRWIVHAWVLMTNHYHLIIETPEAPSLSLGVKRINERYASWFNTRHDRVGHLFQGRFKGILVERESHLLELLRYVVLNPVRSGLVAYAGDWAWSNYKSTAGLREPEEWLELDWTLSQFDLRDRAIAHEKYRQFVADARGAAYKPGESLAGQIYLGSRAFHEQMRKLIDARPRSDEHPRPQKDLGRPSFDAILRAVRDVFELEESMLLAMGRGSGRKALAYLSSREGGLSHVAIAARLGVSGQAVAKMISVASRMESSSEGFRELVRLARRRIG